MSEQRLVTPDRRYFVVRGRLWRCTNPALPEEERAALTSELMQARRAIAAAGRRGDAKAMKAARATVHSVKVALGERGPAWWTDGAPDLNRRMARSTPYAAWYGSAFDPPVSAASVRACFHEVDHLMTHPERC